MLEDYLAQVQPVAIWNNASGVWVKPATANLFCAHLELFSVTWPTSGMTLNGQAFELPTQVRPTTNSESLLLRSPKASEGQGGALGEAEALRRGNTVGVRDQVMDLVASQGLQVSRQADNLLPTVKARDSQAEGYEAGLRRSQPQVGTIVKGIVDGDERVTGLLSLQVSQTEANALMPTPTARDYKDSQAPHERDGVVQTDTVARAVFNSGEIDLMGTPRTSSANVANDLAMLPTPQVDDSKNTGHNQDRRPTLASEVWEAERTTSWGKFEPAIRRWEQTLDRPAPAPTKPDGKDGAHRLSSKFTEWMMGLPDGWITDCGLSRNEELKACGNGVVPQQAELALRILLEGLELPAGGGQVNLPTPTVADQRDGKYFRSVAVKNLERGLNRGLNLNNIVEAVGVDWQEGDTFSMTAEGLKKNG